MGQWHRLPDNIALANPIDHARKECLLLRFQRLCGILQFSKDLPLALVHLQTFK